MTLTNTEVIETKNGTPAHLSMYAADVHGPGAVVRAVHELIAGEVASVAFAVCDRLPEGSGSEPEIKKIIRWARMPGAACVRYCGEDGKPDSAGSHTLIGCGNVDIVGTISDLDAMQVVAAMVNELAQRSYWYYRLRT